ncbi:PREDICTED: uncharacterized protein LOC108773083 [Cyphomyrmex costatus]|uniref:DUF4773 domain-containing protein n=1 Tax=Cyphomyrmex costatus TaxID=456900 RepID=A0A195D7V3_9HYME|nr:PREDICTED: uncharacterized protein LOC108773083 [Cyphomyrmex costatus]KYN08534.1 hypothetical protein ALC62_00518 [Cyphomyrmex costatus]
MKQLRHVGFMDIAFIGMFCIVVVKATGQDEITPTIFPLDNETYNEYFIKMNDNGCKCIQYNCGCCQLLIWDAVSLDGKLCVNASYLEKDYGISLTVTYNNFAIINETISARNPPPICFGEDIIDAVDVEICLHVYDINIDGDKFHVCFEIYGKIMKLPITKIKLGCLQTKLHDKMEYIENNWSKLFLKKTKNDLPIVTRV